jgi:hypothetical protein
VRLPRSDEPVPTWERVVAVLGVCFAILLAIRGEWVWAALIGGLPALAIALDGFVALGRALGYLDRQEK